MKNPTPPVIANVGLVPRNNKKRALLAGAVGLVVAAAIGGGYWWTSQSRQTASTSPAAANDAKVVVSASPAALTTATPVAAKQYGDKYANGILPVGDNKYATSGPKKGYVYECHINTAETGGAGSRGSWFSSDGKTWDVNKKYKVSGSVSWKPVMTNTVSGGTRTIQSNGYPSHFTGVFPIQSSDAAYKYDRNPNSIKAQSLTYTLTANPTALTSPGCMGGEVGIMLTGIPIFTGFDAGYRDAGAWEVQDGCDGHPQVSGEYHYHTLSRCIKDAGASTVIGFAFDGFPITGPKVGPGNIITTDDLDECHGMTSTITLEGKQVSMYHYVMTQDFPYSVSCFRGQASRSVPTGGGGQMPPPR